MPSKTIDREASDKTKGFRLQKLRAIKLMLDSIDSCQYFYTATECFEDISHNEYSTNSSEEYFEEDKNYSNNKNFTVFSDEVRNALVSFFDVLCFKWRNSNTVRLGFYTTASIGKEKKTTLSNGVKIKLPQKPILEYLHSPEDLEDSVVETVKEIVVDEYRTQYASKDISGYLEDLESMSIADFKSFLLKITWEFGEEDDVQLKETVLQQIRSSYLYTNKCNGKEELVFSQLMELLDERQHMDDFAQRFVHTSDVELVFKKVESSVLDERIPLASDRLIAKKEIHFGMDVKEFVANLPISMRQFVYGFIVNYLGGEGDNVVFGGRDSEMESLVNLLYSVDKNCLLVTSPIGCGKSAFLTRWVFSSSLKDWQFVFFPISARFKTNRFEVFVESLASQLACILGVSLTVPDTHKSEFFEAKIIELISNIENSHIKLVIVVDGLDEANGWSPESTLGLLNLKGNIKLICSARETVDRDFGRWCHLLRWDAGNVLAVTLGKLSINEVNSAVSDFNLSDIEKSDLASVLHQLSEGEPLLLEIYCKKAADLISREGMFSELEEIPPGFQYFFDNWIEEISENVTDRNLLNYILATLACAIEPINIKDLEEVISNLAKEKVRIFPIDFKPMSRYVISDPYDGTYVFNHPKFSDYLKEAYFNRAGLISECEMAYVYWGENAIRNLGNKQEEYSDMSSYLLSNYCNHLGIAQAELRFYLLLLGESWRLSHLHSATRHHGFARDVECVWDRLEREYFHFQNISEYFFVKTVFHCSMYLGSIRSLGKNMPENLFALAVKHNIVSLSYALQKIKQVHTDDYAVKLIGMMDVLPESHIEEALFHLNSTTDKSTKFNLALTVLDKLDGRYADEAEKILFEIIEEEGISEENRADFIYRYISKTKSKKYLNEFKECLSFKSDGCMRAAYNALYYSLKDVGKLNDNFIEIIEQMNAEVQKSRRLRILIRIVVDIAPIYLKESFSIIENLAEEIVAEESKLIEISMISAHEVMEAELASIIVAVGIYCERFGNTYVESEWGKVLSVIDNLQDSYFKKSILIDAINMVGVEMRSSLIERGFRVIDNLKSSNNLSFGLAAMSALTDDPDRQIDAVRKAFSAAERIEDLTNQMDSKLRLAQAIGDKEQIFESMIPQLLEHENIHSSLNVLCKLIESTNGKFKIKCVTLFLLFVQNMPVKDKVEKLQVLFKVCPEKLSDKNIYREFSLSCHVLSDAPVEKSIFLWNGALKYLQSEDRKKILSKLCPALCVANLSAGVVFYNIISVISYVEDSDKKILVEKCRKYINSCKDNAEVARTSIQLYGATKNEKDLDGFFNVKNELNLVDRLRNLLDLINARTVGAADKEVSELHQEYNDCPDLSLVSGILPRIYEFLDIESSEKVSVLIGLADRIDDPSKVGYLLQTASQHVRKNDNAIANIWELSKKAQSPARVLKPLLIKVDNRIEAKLINDILRHAAKEGRGAILDLIRDEHCALSLFHNDQFSSQLIRLIDDSAHRWP